MHSLAIIPARGGSKRLPRKNILPFHGKPMFIWTVEAAIKSALFARVIVSTEDKEIADCAKSYNFEVMNRPPELATDASTCVQVCLHVLDTFERQGENFDALCCLYATAPLRRAEDIAATMRLLGSKTKNEADFAFAVTSYQHSPYQALMSDLDGFLSPAWPVLVKKKSQELPTPLIGNGSTYAARVPAFKHYKDFYGPRLKGHLMSGLQSIDIDTEDDYKRALLAATILNNEA